MKRFISTPPVFTTPLEKLKYSLDQLARTRVSRNQMSSSIESIKKQYNNDIAHTASKKAPKTFMSKISKLGTIFTRQETVEFDHDRCRELLTCLQSFPSQQGQLLERLKTHSNEIGILADQIVHLHNLTRTPDINITEASALLDTVLRTILKQVQGNDIHGNSIKAELLTNILLDPIVSLREVSADILLNILDTDPSNKHELMQLYVAVKKQSQNLVSIQDWEQNIPLQLNSMTLKAASPKAHWTTNKHIFFSSLQALVYSKNDLFFRTNLTTLQQIAKSISTQYKSKFHTEIDAMNSQAEEHFYKKNWTEFYCEYRAKKMINEQLEQSNQDPQIINPIQVGVKLSSQEIKESISSVSDVEGAPQENLSHISSSIHGEEVDRYNKESDKIEEEFHLPQPFIDLCLDSNKVRNIQNREELIESHLTAINSKGKKEKQIDQKIEGVVWLIINARDAEEEKRLLTTYRDSFIGLSWAWTFYSYFEQSKNQDLLLELFVESILRQASLSDNEGMAKQKVEETNKPPKEKKKSKKDKVDKKLISSPI